MINSWRGHPIKLLGKTWVYEDTECPVSENKDRVCGKCKKENTPEGHDACFGELPGVVNACCGHGCTRQAYVQLLDGTIIMGGDALTVMAILARAEGDSL